ncbi:hypothetical protein D9619_006470 [Psilocybe cf. subviscida]|uniref:Serine protease n=1 Tax=Psilocybe cf. subviscida TaxID=2480587 RepID=A0A8H5B408_9AGAR|nr:hypothetical protein D9619_006470 [Psilocybe cf. subviscida]
MNPDVPGIPSHLEHTFYYYGIPSQPALVARSSTHRWVEPVGAEAYLVTKELMPVGPHNLVQIWEPTLSTLVEKYLDSQKITWSSIDPARIGYTGSPAPPVILWIGVAPRSLMAAKGLEVALGCHKILVDHGVDDVHVELRESMVYLYAKLYKTVRTIDPTAQAREPFATTLGLPIANASTPNLEGTGGFFFVDSNRPGKLFLLTARHVLFHPDRTKNELYIHSSSQPPVKVILLGDDALKNCTGAIPEEILGKESVLQQLQARKRSVDKQDDDEAEEERKEVLRLEGEAQKAITALRQLLDEVRRDWDPPADRVIGHVVLSPPLGFGVGPAQYTEDWAVVEVYSSAVNKSNFKANCIDLGTSIRVEHFTSWMHPHPSNPSSFTYPGDRLIRFSGTITDSELGNTNRQTLDHDGQPALMVIKRGGASGLTVGRLNDIRSVKHDYFEGKDGQSSREVAIFPRNSKSRPFSDPGDSGSAVIDGTGRIAGILTGGAGATPVSDCTYVTPISFLIHQLQRYGFNPNIFPTIDDLSS